MQDPFTVGIPTGINRFKKVSRLILSKYSGGTGVCIDLANLLSRSQ